jgi:hypothetical protein
VNLPVQNRHAPAGFVCLDLIEPSFSRVIHLRESAVVRESASRSGVKGLSY